VSRRERTLWAWAAGICALVFASILPAASVATALRERGLLGATTLVIVGAASLGVLVTAARRPARWRVWSVLALAAAVTGLVVSTLEYAALALLVEGALRDRLGASRPLEPQAWGLAALAASACGLVDEALQGLVPARVCDLRDVVLDGGSGATALAFAVAYRAARTRDVRG
jgi:hypothetical protein